MTGEAPEREALTQFLRDLGRDGGAGDSSLMRYVYDQLRSTAEGYMRSQRGAVSLQPTALVHDAFLKLFDRSDSIPWNDRVHFFALAARAMRQILVDHARRRGLRSGPEDSVTLDGVSGRAGNEEQVDLIDLDEALRELADLDERESRVVELRYFGGLAIPDVARVLGVSHATVERDWATARAWLGRRLSAE